MFYLLTKLLYMDLLDLLLYVLFTNQITIYRPTRFTFFYIVYNREAILPIKIRFLTWRILR
jgi:hypothetical protein